MNKTGLATPLIRQGWLRALLYIISLLLFVTTILAGFVYGFYRVDSDLTAIQKLLKGDAVMYISGIFFILILVITYIFRRWVDRKSFGSLGLKLEGYGRDAFAGAGLAIFMMGASTLILKWTGHLKWMDIILDSRALFLSFGNILLIAFYEELVFRGYILNNLMDSFPKWLALGISALIFSLYHGTYTGFFSLANALIIGLLLGLNYIYTRNLWFSICFHIVWLFMAGPVLGYSGNESFQTLLQTELNGDENITGGAAGLEGSAILMAVSLLSGLALYLFLRKKFNPRSLPVPGQI
jgi:uncharacterized protein